MATSDSDSELAILSLVAKQIANLKKRVYDLKSLAIAAAIPSKRNHSAYDLGGEGEHSLKHHFY